MRTTIRIALLGLIIAAVVGVPAAGAHGRRTPPPPRVQASAWASRAVQGGTLVVAARVRLPRGLARTGVAPAATAVVHFASGDVTVELQGRTWSARGHRFAPRAWWSPVRVWRGAVRVPVSATEQVGPVKVDLTITLGDGSVKLTTFGRVRRSRTAPPPTTDPTDPPCTAGCDEL